MQGGECTNTSSTSTDDTLFAVKRLTTAVPRVREFQRSYEKAVPTVPLDEVVALVRRRASWSEMEQLIANSTPHGFLIYFKNDVRPVMQLAGDTADCIAYLMDNHIIAEQMFRHDPRAMLYAPLHVVIWEDSTDAAWFSVDQPQHAVCQLRHPRDLKGRRRARPEAGGTSGRAARRCAERVARELERAGFGACQAAPNRTPLRASRSRARLLKT
jgi:uncharacterized protein (DUF302 family)